MHWLVSIVNIKQIIYFHKRKAQLWSCIDQLVCGNICETLDTFLQVDFSYDPDIDRVIRHQLLGRIAEKETEYTWKPREDGKLVYKTLPIQGAIVMINITVASHKHVNVYSNTFVRVNLSYRVVRTTNTTSKPVCSFSKNNWAWVGTHLVLFSLFLVFQATRSVAIDNDHDFEFSSLNMCYLLEILTYSMIWGLQIVKRNQ